MAAAKHDESARLMASRRAPTMVISLLALLFLGASRPSVSPFTALQDGFESVVLRQDIWSDLRLVPGAAKIQHTIVRSGERALAITVRPGHDPLRDGTDRAELAEAEAVRLPPGGDIWYGFSMRIGEALPADGNRIVIGQWHHMMAGSPFVAQRFRNGIFMISVQDGGCRVYIAWQAGGERKNREDCRVVVENFADLPSADSGWIDMVYRVRSDPDGDGLVEVWANGTRIARASGHIGHAGMRRQFFKFGPYRDPVAYPTTVYLDNFRRGRSFSQVDPSRD